MNWSKPYYGVQHLSGTKLRTYATVADHGTFANAYILNFNSGAGFTPIVEQDFDTAADARTWLEQQVKQLQLVAA